MGRAPKIQKTISKKLSDLDDHLFLLHEALSKLASGQTAFFKSLAAELRVLVCISSGTEGLLWRLVEEFQIPDPVHVHLAGNLKRDHPLAMGLTYAFAPVLRAGLGDPRLPPALYSLKRIIKNCEALYISGKGITHECLIKDIAQQMGTAHEDEGIAPYLVELSEILSSNQQPFVQVLTSDALLVLEVGDRVLKYAQVTQNYPRKYTLVPPQDFKAAPVQGSNDFEYNSNNQLPKEGTLFFLIDHPQSDWRIDNNKYIFGALQKGHLKVIPTKYEDGSLEIIIDGLTIDPVLARRPIPRSIQPGVSIAITWKGPEVSIYFNGQNVETVTLQ